MPNIPSFAPNNNFNGVGDFVRALTGGGAQKEAGYRNEMTAINGLESKLAEAAMRKRQNEAQAGINAELVTQLGIPPEMAPAVSQLLGAGGGVNASVNDYAGGLGKLFEQGLRQKAVQAAGADPERYSPVNVPLVGLSSGPVENNEIKGGHLVLDRFGNDFKPIPTDETKAKIDATQALTRQREASAGASMARAAVSNRTDPNRPRSSGRKPEGKPAGGKRKVFNPATGRLE